MLRLRVSCLTFGGWFSYVWGLVSVTLVSSFSYVWGLVSVKFGG